MAEKLPSCFLGRLVVGLLRSYASAIMYGRYNASATYNVKRDALLRTCLLRLSQPRPELAHLLEAGATAWKELHPAAQVPPVINAKLALLKLNMHYLRGNTSLQQHDAAQNDSSASCFRMRCGRFGVSNSRCEVGKSVWGICTAMSLYSATLYVNSTNSGELLRNAHIWAREGLLRSCSCYALARTVVADLEGGFRWTLQNFRTIAIAELYA